MRIADSGRAGWTRSRLLLWLRRAFDIMVVGVMVLALLETISFLTGLTRGLVG
jgi:hypothetical protein